MSNKTEQINELSFNPYLTLKVVETNVDMTELLTEKTKLTFPMLYTLTKDNQLPKGVVECLEEVFTYLIKPNDTFLSKYKQLAFTENISIKTTTSVVEVDEKPKNKKSRKLPRRYGRVSILADISKQDGKPTDVQRAMLKVCDLKNDWCRLSDKLIHDNFMPNKKLTRSDYMTIISAIKTMEQVLEDIFEK